VLCQLSYKGKTPARMVMGTTANLFSLEKLQKKGNFVKSQRGILQIFLRKLTGWNYLYNI
jgi:hypothetical protein